MVWFAASALVFASLASAADPDPAALASTTEQRLLAERWVKDLESERYRDRDRASRELAAMSRIALGTIEKTLAETTSAEVRARCEILRPEMQKADQAARLNAFLADVAGKYDHKLTGWRAFHEITGTTPAARALFADMYRSKPSADLMVAAGGAKEDFAKAIVYRRVELYNRMYGRNTPIVLGAANNANAPRIPPTPAELSGLLFAESLAGSLADKRMSYAVSAMVAQPANRAFILDAEKGEPLVKVFAQWCETRTDLPDMYSAMTVAASLDLKTLPTKKYADRILELKSGPTPFHRANALSILARYTGKSELPRMLAQFDDKTALPITWVNARGQLEREIVEMRDFALAMAVVLTEQKPDDYGFLSRSKGYIADYTYTNYRFESDEKRTAAFAKWAEYAKQPKK